MYKKRKCRTLLKIARTEMFGSIYDALLRNTRSDDVNTKTMNELKEHVGSCGLTFINSQEMFNMAMKYVSGVASLWSHSLMYLKFLELFINKNVRTIAVHGEILPSYYNRILYAIAKPEKGDNLIKFRVDIKLEVRHKNTFAIHHFVEYCKNLAHLSIGEASDELIWTISSNCKNLKSLTMDDSHNVVTQVGIECLHQGVCRNTLTSVEIITKQHITTVDECAIVFIDIPLKYTFRSLILNLPNLYFLVDYDVQSDLISINEADPNFRTCLKIVIIKSTTNTRNMEIIVQMCPQLQEIVIHGLMDVEPLRPLSTANNLIAFNLYEIGDEMDLMPTLKAIGRNLVKICLQLNEEGITLDIGILTEYCPRLVILNFSNLTLIYTNDTIFTNLQECYLSNMENYGDTIERFVQNHSSTQLQKLTLMGFTEPFTDTHIERIFTQNSTRSKFLNLKVIWFSDIGNLTQRSLQILTDNCPLLLNIIGISGWGMSPDEVTLQSDRYTEKNAAVIF